MIKNWYIVKHLQYKIPKLKQKYNPLLGLYFYFAILCKL